MVITLQVQMNKMIRIMKEIPMTMRNMTVLVVMLHLEIVHVIMSIQETLKRRGYSWWVTTGVVNVVNVTLKLTVAAVAVYFMKIVYKIYNILLAL
jgi:hypothetical protein